MAVIVPMLVEAYLTDGVQAETKRIPQVSPDYSSALFRSFLGSKNTPKPVDSKMPPLKRGVHLHFILPDMLKRADDTNSFPAVPNRFLVTRFLSQSGEVTVKQWVVESDFISLEEKYAGNVAIPWFQDEGENKFRYCGRCYEAGDKPQETETYLEKLTALGGGDPLFTAYYPNCQSIFGFRDNMEGVEEGALAAYFVAGFFQNGKQDPFYGVKTEEEFRSVLQKHDLSVTGEGIADSLVLFGLVDGIQWTNGTITNKIPTGKIEAAVGKTSAEALSVSVEEVTGRQEEDFQRLFTAMQYAEENILSEIDGMKLLDDELLLRQFQRVDGENGTYALRGSIQEKKQEAEAYAEVLSEKQKLDSVSGECAGEREKLFCLWEQYVMKLESGESMEKTAVSDMLARIRKTADRIVELEKTAEALRGTISGKVTEHMEKNGEESFYVPKEPALLLYGEGVKRSYAFGENGRYTNNGTLSCQMDVLQSNIAASQIAGLFEHQATELSEEYEALFCQAALLIGESRKKIEEAFGEVTVKGEISPLAVNREPEDFVTLFMDWKLLFYPLRSSGDDEEDNTLSKCRFTYGDMEFVPAEEVQSRHLVYSGRNILTPLVTVNLKQRLLDYIERKKKSGEPVPDYEKELELLDKLPVVSQNMGGLNEQLAARLQAFEFPIMSNGGDEEEAKAVAEHSSGSRTSVLPEYPLFPIRGGYFQLYQLQIVGTFGQIQTVCVPSEKQVFHVLYGDSIKSPADGYGYLCPGFLTPSRLSVRWLWEDGKYSSSAEHTTPVEGFLVPELLNGRLAAYDKEGTALGELKKVKRNGEEKMRWVSAPGLPDQLSDLDTSELLKNFLQRLLDEKSAFTQVMRVIGQVLEKTVPDGIPEEIWGKTLALSKAEAALEFERLPEFTKSFEDFGKDNTLGTEKIRIPMAFGDINRNLDGLVGVFTSEKFEEMIPPFGMEGEENSYVRYGKMLSISRDDGKVPLYFLAEAAETITVQTGLHPISFVRLFPEHSRTAGELTLSAQLAPILTPAGKAELLTADGEKKERLQFQVRTGDEAVEWDLSVMDAVLKDTVLCDGRIAWRQNEKEESIYGQTD